MSTINRVAHGLTAGQRVVFSNLVGGAPIDVDYVYYVISAGLAADTFQISETDEGTPLTFATLTSADMQVVPETVDEDTFGTDYAAITDPADVMAPPEPLPTPSPPALTSDTTTGTVRLKATLPAWPEAQIRVIEVAFTSEYTVPASAPASPIWDNAVIQAVPVSTTSIAIRAHAVTWYSARARYVDVYGNTSSWSTVDDEQTVTGYDSINALSAAEAALLDHLIGTVEIEDGAITADLLAATIVLGSLIVAGDPDAQHVEMDEAGIRLVDASDVTIVSIPTDPLQPVYVQGNVDAGTLTVHDNTTLETVVSLAEGAVMTAEAGVVAPAAAPVLVSGYESPITPSDNNVNDWGLAWDGTYICKVRLETGSAPHDVFIDRWTTAGSLNNTITCDFTVNAFVDGIASDGTDYYLYFVDGSTCTLKKVNSSGVTQASATISADITGTKGQSGGVFWDATTSRLVVTTTVGTGAGTQFRFRLYNSSLALQSTVDATGANTVGGNSVNITGAARNGTEYWVQSYGATASERAVHAFTASTGAYVANADWGYNSAGVYIVGAGLAYDGSNFWFHNTSGVFNKATNWTWTTESAKYWVAYSWYDPDGTTHETAIGPRASITMYRRMRLSVTSATIPGTGGADEPDNARTYMERNATEPTVGTYNLQATDAATQRYLITFDTGGAADGTGTAFGAGAAAELKSSTAGWSLKGDGTATLGLVTTGGKPPVVNVYASDTTWNKPAGIAYIIVECVGGGGGGGGTAATAAGQFAAAAGGGGGGYTRKLFTAANLSGDSTFDVVSGNGGAGATAGNNTGTTGDTSSFAGTGISTVTATGGVGGGGSPSAGAANWSAGGAGGTGSNGDFSADGSHGLGARILNGPLVASSGVGGSSHLGGMSQHRVGSGAGIAGKTYGGGGGGAIQLTSSAGALAGGDGGDGVVIVTEYYVG